jgi:hypothetical protein
MNWKRRRVLMILPPPPPGPILIEGCWLIQVLKGVKS